MTESLKNDDGLIYAFAEYSVVDKQGDFDNEGNYVWIAEWFIAPQYRNKGVIKKLGWKIWDRVHWATHFYFQRKSKYGERIRTYRIDSLLKEAV